MKLKFIGISIVLFVALFLLIGSKMENNIEVKSSAFAPSENIPDKYTAYFANISPELSWTSIEGAQSYVFIMDDPDAPSAQNHYPDPYVHCVIYDIPSTITEFAEGQLNSEKTIASTGAVCGTNQAGSHIYHGPKPPQGSGPHRYFFKIYALDVASIELPKGATKDLVMQKVERYKIGEGGLVGVYEQR